MCACVNAHVKQQQYRHCLFLDFCDTRLDAVIDTRQQLLEEFTDERLSEKYNIIAGSRVAVSNVSVHVRSTRHMHFVDALDSFTRQLDDIRQKQISTEHIRHLHAIAWWFTRLMLLYVKRCSTSSTTPTTDSSLASSRFSLRNPNLEHFSFYDKRLSVCIFECTTILRIKCLFICSPFSLNCASKIILPIHQLCFRRNFLSLLDIDLPHSHLCRLPQAFRKQLN